MASESPMADAPALVGAARATPTSTPNSTSAVVLQELFQVAQLDVRVPTDSERNEDGEGGLGEEVEKDRSLAFYDEVLPVVVSLSLPSSSKDHLPGPPDQSPPVTLSLPPSLHAQAWSDPVIPPALNAFFSALEPALEAAYVSPIPLALAQRTGGAGAGGGGGSMRHEAVPFFGEVWNAEKERRLDEEEAGQEKEKEKEKERMRSEPTAQENGVAGSKRSERRRRGGWVRWNGREERWEARWQMRIPLVWVRTRSPTPLLRLTAACTLRTSTTTSGTEIKPDEEEEEEKPEEGREVTKFEEVNLLEGLQGSPSFISSDDPSKSRLAIPLSRIASATPTVVSASSSHLPAQSSEADLVALGGPVAGTSSSPGAATPAANKALPVLPGRRDPEARVAEVLTRNSRRMLEVRSAVQVRMRTMWTPGIAEEAFETAVGSSASVSAAAPPSGRSSEGKQTEDGPPSLSNSAETSEESDADGDDDGDEELTSDDQRSLVLCVELESNPDCVGLNFEVTGVDVRVSGKGAEARLIRAPLGQGGAGRTRLPLTLREADQQNLLYVVTFRPEDDAYQPGLPPPTPLYPETPSTVLGGRTPRTTGFGRLGGHDKYAAAMADAQRFVSITVEGRPVPSSASDGAAEAEMAPFASRFTSQLDLSPFRQAIERKRESEAAIATAGLHHGLYTAAIGVGGAGAVGFFARTPASAYVGASAASSAFGSRIFPDSPAAGARRHGHGNGSGSLASALAKAGGVDKDARRRLIAHYLSQAQANAAADRAATLSVSQTPRTAGFPRSPGLPVPPWAAADGEGGGRRSAGSLLLGGGGGGIVVAEGLPHSPLSGGYYGSPSPSPRPTSRPSPMSAGFGSSSPRYPSSAAAPATRASSFAPGASLAPPRSGGSVSVNVNGNGNGNGNGNRAGQHRPAQLSLRESAVADAEREARRSEVMPWGFPGPGGAGEDPYVMGLPGAEKEGLLITARVVRTAHEDGRDGDGERVKSGGAEGSRKKGGGKAKAEIKVLDRIAVEVFIFNRSLASKRYTISVGSSVGDGERGSKQGAAPSQRASMMSSPANTLLRTHAHRRPALTAIDDAVRIGPVPPSSSSAVRIRFVALGAGTHALEPLVLTDLDDGRQIWLREVGSVVVT